MILLISLKKIDFDDKLKNSNNNLTSSKTKHVLAESELNELSEIEFPFIDGSIGRNVIIFGADMSSSVHINNKNENILFLGKGSTQGLYYTILTAESVYPINFT